MSHVPTVLKSDRSVFDKMLAVDDNEFPYLDMIIVCFILFDNSLFWPLYGYIPNAKTFLFSYVRMKKSLFQVGKYQRKNHRYVE